LNNNMFSKAAVWLVIALVLFTVFKQFDKPRVQEGVSYSQFMDDAKRLTTNPTPSSPRCITSGRRS
jgi:hypothetical protein